MKIDLDAKELFQKIGQKIEYMRFMKKMTVKQMAYLVDLTESAYRNIERGDNTSYHYKIISDSCNI